jgi:CheY-like chemotaxis protein
VKYPAETQLSILHIEDDKTVAQLVGEILAANGIEVDSCVSGTTALKILTSDAHYDMIICDNDLPGLTGLELVRRARNIARWRGTPIIMLSAEDCENEAWRAGVSEFLRKPRDIERVASTIKRLLADLKEKAE